MDIGTLRTLIESHKASTPIQAPAAMLVENEKIERASFDLVVKQMKFDFQAWRVLSSKMDNYTNYIGHLKLQWRIDVLKEHTACAQTLLANCSVFSTFADPKALERDLIKFRSEICKNTQVLESNLVV